MAVFLCLSLQVSHIDVCIFLRVYSSILLICRSLSAILAPMDKVRQWVVPGFILFAMYKIL